MSETWNVTENSCAGWLPEMCRCLNRAKSDWQVGSDGPLIWRGTAGRFQSGAVTLLPCTSIGRMDEVVIEMPVGDDRAAACKYAVNYWSFHHRHIRSGGSRKTVWQRAVSSCSHLLGRQEQGADRVRCRRESRCPRTWSKVALGPVQDDVDVGDGFACADSNGVALERNIVSRLILLPELVLAGIRYWRIQRPHAGSIDERVIDRLDLYRVRAGKNGDFVVADQSG